MTCVTLSASSKYPVDISYMVADLKYSQEHGVKICEIQHGIASTLLGDLFLYPPTGLVSPKIADVFAEFPLKKWTTPSSIVFPTLLSSLLKSPKWKEKNFIGLVITDDEFQYRATLAPNNPSDISSYHAMLYIQPKVLKNYDAFNTQYPGVITVDAATHPYWADKYLMSLLFTTSPTLAQIKPEWGIYAKEHTPTLAMQIQQEIPGDMYVIKPRGAFLGNGVIIVSSDDLDATLQYILTKSDELKNDKDPSYNYWNRDPYDSFLVEKYYPSDTVQVKKLNNKIFEPTMRVAFMLIYNNQTIETRFLGGYWLLPHKAIDETGSLNETKKAYCKQPYFTKASAKVLKKVQKQLEATLPLLYQEMLEGTFSSLESSQT